MKTHVFKCLFGYFQMGLAAEKAEKQQEPKPRRFIIPQLMIVGVSQIVMSLCHSNKLKLTNRWKQEILQPAGVKVLEMQNNTPK